jgi:mono/diheme cytochrome c family protein
MELLTGLHHSVSKVVLRWGVPFGLTLLLAACATPRSLPDGPTPIPTLIPVIEPASPLSEPTAPVFTVLSYPARLPSAELGQTLYQTHCVSCHGEDGNGVVPEARNFNDLDYMRGNTPASFYSAITEGRGEMPAFRDTLTSDERWDVLFYVWRFSTSTENLTLGHSLYDTYCTACHGVDGTGQVLGAADLSDLRLVAERAPRDFYLTVTQGKGSMPAWQGRLSQEERWAVIDYLGTFTYDPSLPEDVSVTPEATTVAAEVTCDPAYLSESNPFAWDDADAIAAGGAIYTQSCAVCHAADGTGTLPDIPDLSSAEAHSTLLDNSGQYLCIVAEGQKAMPGWKETLSTDEMWQVLTFISTLAK